ncbi:MAG: hypothetical protein C0394_06975 [Syntrophus sp. (in: bacteria)]|nr:hypothetical protein [Syntrophus sp. (in: bacteria)]
MRRKTKKVLVTILTILLTTITAFTTSFASAHEIKEPGVSASPRIVAGFLTMEADGHCPSCPSDSHPNDDHRHFCCGTNSSYSQDTQTGHQQPRMPEASLIVLEEYQAFPDVCLKIFIPPDNLA